MIARGKKRVAALQEGGAVNAQLYGEDLLGGLGRLYVLLEKPEAYGLPADPQYPAITTLWQKGVQPFGKVVLGASIIGIAAAWIIIRRNIRMEEVE
jgi:formate dehydrogenase iron-sulfur subunit